MRHALVLSTLFAVACGGSPASEAKPPITVFAAASLARPLRALADSFQRHDGTRSQVELGGSLEQSRKLTDLGRVPDVLMLVDDDVVAALVPTYLDWYVRFATNRFVVAYGPRSAHGDSITAENWWQIVARPGVRLGRADPQTAPAGRHALGILERSSAFYQQPRLTDTLLARSPRALLRPSATELAALLETGEVDYILEYESVARQYGFRFVQLPAELAPSILYGIAVPRSAVRRADAVRFVSYVLSPRGKDILRGYQTNVLEVPVAIGSHIPAEITEVVRTVTTAASPTTPP